MKKSYIDFENKPLPDHTKIDYYECLAKIILENLFIDELKELIISDKPDLQSIYKDIGIEVTQAINQQQKENESLYAKISHGLIKNKENAIKKINSSYQPRKAFINGNIIEEPERYYDGLLVGIPDDFVLIIESFKDKITKLNELEYRRFDKNYLFVFSTVIADEGMILEATNEMIDYQKKFDIKFNKVIINVFSQIYICDLDNKQGEVINVNGNIYDMCMQARECVIQEEIVN